MTRYIGDVHGKWNRYKKVIANCKDSIQVGDMGVGFFTTNIDGELVACSNPPYDHMVRGNHRFIRGNHDNPEVCARQRQYIPDGFYENSTMFVGGALSVNKQYRIRNRDWWETEQLSQDEFYKIMDLYETHKPSIMVTHDCPESITHLVDTRNKILYPNRTAAALGSMLYIHRPELWIFGHHHNSFDSVINGTRFICLAELQYIDIA